MDAGICLETAMQNVRPVRTGQANGTKAEESGQTQEFQQLLTRQTQTTASCQTSEKKQQAGTQEQEQQAPEQLETLAQLAMALCFPQAEQTIVENTEPAATPTGAAGLTGLALQAGQMVAQESGQQNTAAPVVQTGEPFVTDPAPVAEPAVQASPELTASDAEESLLQQGETGTGEQSGSAALPEAEVISSSWHTALFGELEQAPVRVGDAPVDMTRPAQQVEQQLNLRLQSALERGSDQLTIRLDPAELGTVVAKFTTTPEGVLHVVLHAESEQTARILQEHAPALGLLLQENSQSQVQVQVTQPQQEQTGWQQDGQNGGQQQRQHNRREPDRKESESFLHQLRLGLVQQSVQSV